MKGHEVWKGEAMTRSGPLTIGCAVLIAAGGILVGGPAPDVAAGSRLSYCSLEAGLKVKNDGSNGASGNTYLYIAYINAGSAACILQGVPGVQPVAGPAHASVGPSSKHQRTKGRGGVVRLAPRGGTANTVYWTFVTAEEPPRCHGTATDGIMIHLTGVRAFFVALHFPTQLASDVCTTLQSATTDGVSGRPGGP